MVKSFSQGQLKDNSGGCPCMVALRKIAWRNVLLKRENKRMKGVLREHGLA